VLSSGGGLWEQAEARAGTWRLSGWVGPAALPAPAGALRMRRRLERDFSGMEQVTLTRTLRGFSAFRAWSQERASRRTATH
jgi:hypothetical protein